ncbi:hypothetical protein PUMCH_002726 [Australozyma saopauloensis]|uniref:Vacuolar protein-sorting-associated protein 36 n=1 Tax=Australozyma saopauloensis TaxID=291208 RepID=A0AAX4HA78_9ASCO|nr:hypothetical protein PUMCH_002726 [[Candida] saopauloensis]
MPPLSVWQQVLVNKSNRPVLASDEHNVYIKDGIGLYQGRLKIKKYQNGRLYLTNRRIIWLDQNDQQRPIAVELSAIERIELVEGFLRSSPKIKAFLKQNEETSIKGEAMDVSGSTPKGSFDQLNVLDAALRLRSSTVTWVCVICLYNNLISTDCDLNAALPTCISCGIPPSRAQIERVLAEADELSRELTLNGPPPNLEACPKCTFVNHPSMRYCELCGTALRLVSSSLMKRLQSLDNPSSLSIISENPMGLILEDKEEYTNNIPYVKFSFRKGGELASYQHLLEEIQSIQWLALEAKGAINGEGTKIVELREPSPQKELVGGIRGLEKLDQLKRKQNEMVLSLSLDDFEQLMYKAQDILNLASTFKTVIKPQRHSFNIEGKTMPPLLFNKSSSLYHQELLRHVSEFLLNFELTSVTSMITLQDLFASYNRFLILSQGFGTELIPPQDLTKSLDLVDKLKMPIRLKTYLSGLVVVARRSHDLQSLHRVLLQYLIDEENSFTYEKYKSELLADNDGYMRDKYRVFNGLTVSQIADHYGWSPAVCAEELELCLEEQLLVVDEHISGTFYYANVFDPTILARLANEESQKKDAQNDVLAQQKLISDKLKTTYDADQNLIRVSDYSFGLSTSVPSLSPPLSGSLPDSLNQLNGLRFT